MYIWPVTAVVSGQSRLGGTKIRIILNIACNFTFLSLVLLELNDKNGKSFSNFA